MREFESRRGHIQWQIAGCRFAVLGPVCSLQFYLLREITPFGLRQDKGQRGVIDLITRSIMLLDFEYQTFPAPFRLRGVRI